MVQVWSVYYLITTSLFSSNILMLFNYPNINWLKKNNYSLCYDLITTNQLNVEQGHTILWRLSMISKLKYFLNNWSLILGLETLNLSKK